ncbi:hypothetical protein VU12_07895 [Desulfobulbus sp. US4]|nr:hypothetical protein [Desulfobulbus sp. US4]
MNVVSQRRKQDTSLLKASNFFILNKIYATMFDRPEEILSPFFTMRRKIACPAGKPQDSCKEDNMRAQLKDLLFLSTMLVLMDIGGGGGGYDGAMALPNGR